MNAPRIALLLNLQIAYCRRAVRGIAAYEPGRRWVIEGLPAREDSLELIERWKPDGIIAHVLDAEFGQALAKLQIPVVNVSSCVTGLGFPVIDSDHSKVGEFAADYVWGLGLRSFAFFGSDHAGFSRDRESGFRNALAKRRRAVDSHYSDYTLRPPYQFDIDRVHAETKDWLRALPKPTAVFCSDDEHARQLATLCRLLEIGVPDEIALLGVDNDETMCLLSWPQLSSIDNPAEEIGYRAAETLHTMLSDASTHPRDHLVPPIRVIARASTNQFSVDDPAVAKALRYIRKNITDQQMGVDTIAKAAGVSRRSLERRFAKVLKMSVLESVQRTRVERAKTLLRDTAISVDTIASECGFPNHRRLGIVFKAQTQFTPTGFRRAYESDRKVDKPS